MQWLRLSRLILPVLHVSLCLAVGLNPRTVEGSWRWFPVFFVDFPFSILLLPLLFWKKVGMKKRKICKIHKLRNNID